MNAVIGSILENLRSIQIIYEPTVDIFKGDRTNTGDSKELSVNEFIQSYLTTDYRVKKGKIYSLDSESANIDCVVLAPNHPNLITPKREVILAEGVYCAIEVKPDLTSLSKTSEFERSLKQIKSIKNLHRDLEKIDLSILGTPKKPKYFDKIPAILFSKKTADFKDIILKFREKTNDQSLGIDELPDVIFSIEKGLLFYTPHFSHTSYFNMLNDKQKQLFSGAVFMEVSTDDQHVNLLIFLLIFLSLEKPHTPMSDFFIKKYMNQIEAKITYKFDTLEGVTATIQKNPEIIKMIADEIKNKQ